MTPQRDDPASERLLPGRADTRASDADRDAATRVLGAAFAEGRLDGEEHDERVRAALASRTWRDLDLLTADLPAPSYQVTAEPDQGGAGLWPADKCLICALLIMCPPAGIIWLLVAMSRSHSGQRSLATAPWAPAGTETRSEI